jgi:Tol biopolymer transport system component
MLCEIASGRMQRLTQRTSQPPSSDAVVFSPDGKQVAFMRDVDGFNQIFVVTI